PTNSRPGPAAPPPSRPADAPPEAAQGLLEVQPGEHGAVVARPALEDFVEGGVEAAVEDMIEPGHGELRRPGEAEAASGLLPGVLELGDQRRQIAVEIGRAHV